MVRFWESKKGLEEKIPSERAPQEEQNGASFSFLAPSSVELGVFEIHCGDDLYHACTFERESSIGTHNSSLEDAMKLKFAPFCSSRDALSKEILFCRSQNFHFQAENHGL